VPDGDLWLGGTTGDLRLLHSDRYATAGVCLVIRAIRSPFGQATGSRVLAYD
jgi:hypothetical protein